jgi:hypothetical protein
MHYLRAKRGGGMNSTRYQEQVLEGALKEFYAQMKEARGNVKFQQDGAPSHTSNVRTLEGLSRLDCLGCAIEAEVVQRLL